MEHADHIKLTDGGDLDMEAAIQFCIRRFGYDRGYWSGWLPLIDKAAVEEYAWEDCPSEQAKEQGPLFRLVRIIKGRVKAEGRNLSASDFFPLVCAFYYIFLERSGGGEPWSFLSQDVVDWEDKLEVAEEWERLWDKVRYGEGEGLLVKAWKMAQAAKLLVPETLSEKAKKILRLAYELQQQNPGQPILLPQERVAAVLGMQQPDVSKKIETLIKNGFLKLASPHDRLGKKAAEYLCVWVPKKSARSRLK